MAQITKCVIQSGQRQVNLVFIAYASSEGSGEPVHPRSLTRTSAARSYKQWFKKNLQTESQIPGSSEWLGMHNYNLLWWNARRHKFAWCATSDLHDSENTVSECFVKYLYPSHFTMQVSEGEMKSVFEKNRIQDHCATTEMLCMRKMYFKHALPLPPVCHS